MRSKRILPAMLLLLAGFLFTGAALQLQQHRLAEKLIRLHVVANSDQETDQAIKLEVRDAVLQVTEGLTREQLRQSLPQIEQAARGRLRALDCPQTVTVSLKQERFPTRLYENFSLPAGVYESLRVTLGEGAGHNWWCVVFPSICFQASVEDLEAAAVSAGFTESDLALMTGTGEGYVLKFKLLELLNQFKEVLFAP